MSPTLTPAAQATVDAAWLRLHYGPPPGSDPYAGCRGCPCMGTCWCCPPFDRNPFDEAMASWPQAQITVMAFDVPTAEAAHRLAVDSATLALEAPGSLAFLSGNCRQCGTTGPDDHPECTRPQGLPCRHPGRARTSLEACGFNLVAVAAEVLHHPLEWRRNGPVTFITAILHPCDSPQFNSPRK